MKTKFKTYTTRDEAEQRARYLQGRGYWTEIRKTPKGKYRLAWNKEPSVYKETGKRAKWITRVEQVGKAADKELGRGARGTGKSYGKHFARKTSDFDITKGNHPLIGQVYDDDWKPRIAQLPKAP